MNNLIKLIVFFLVIIIYLYLVYRKKYIDFFIAPILDFKETLEFKIDDDDSLLWLNLDLNNIRNMENFSGFEIKSSSYPYYTNKPILNSSSYYKGIFIKMNPEKPFNNIKIGLHNTKLSNFKETLDNMDFCLQFNDNNLVQIKEANNPILNLNVENKKLNSIQNLDYCSSGIQKECVNSMENYKFSVDDNFGIIIFNEIVHYLIITEKYNDEYTQITEHKGLLIHKSKNLPIYPLYPCIISNNDNEIADTKWLVSLTESPSEYSIEYQNENQYKEVPLPKKIPLYDLAPAPSIEQAPSFEDDFDYDNLPPWDRRVLILNGIVRDNKILNLYVKVYNIDQQFLDRMFGVTIILSNDVSERKLNIPYIPYIQQEKLVLGEDNDIIINLDISKSVNFFYKKNLTVQVLFRLGQFTTQGNILSNSFKITF